jgi:hypothetical protein
VSDLRDFLRGERRREQIELAHLALREILPGTVVGRALPAAPTGRNRGRGRDVSVIRPSPNGRHVYLEAHDVTLDGSPIVWDTLVRSQGVDIDLPTSRIPCRADGYYDLALPSVEFDPADLGWVGEATVNIRVDEEPREPFPSGPAYANGGGMKLEPQMLGRIVPGQDTQVSIDAPGAPVAKKIRASMQLVDRQVATVLEPPLDPPNESKGYTHQQNSTSSSTTSVSVGVHSSTEVGDTLVASVVINAPFGSISLNTPPAGWVQRASPGISASSGRVFVFSKIADADDAAGTSSYIWSATGSGLNTISVVQATYDGGWDLDGPVEQAAHTSSSPLSVDAPAGDWLFVVGFAWYGGTTSAFPTVTFTSPTARLVHETNGGEQGSHGHGVNGDGSSTITTSGGSSPNRRAIAVFGVSP